MKEMKPAASLKSCEITDKAMLELIDLARLDPADSAIAGQKDNLVKILDQFQILRAVEMSDGDLGELEFKAVLKLREDNIQSSEIHTPECKSTRLIKGKYFHAPSISENENTIHP